MFYRCTFIKKITLSRVTFLEASSGFFYNIPVIKLRIEQGVYMTQLVF